MDSETIEQHTDNFMNTQYSQGHIIYAYDDTEYEEREFITEMKELQEYKLKQKKTTKIKQNDNTKESQTIHKIADALYQQKFVYVPCIKTGQIGKYSVIQNHIYEILSVDFRYDENYLLMREITKESKPLFGRNSNDIFNYDKQSKSVMEFMRRGYIDLKEWHCIGIEMRENERMKEEIEKMKKEKTIVEIIKSFFGMKDSNQKDKQTFAEEELEYYYRGIIEIPISEFIEYFSFVEGNTSIEMFDYLNKSTNIILDYEPTSMMIEYKGQIEIEISQLIKFPMKLIISPLNEKLITSYFEFDGKEDKTVKRKFRSEIGNKEYIEIVFEISQENMKELKEKKIIPSISLSGNYDNELTFKSPKNNKSIEIPKDCEMKIENKKPEEFGHCELCGDGFTTSDSIFEILYFPDRYCHQSCYQYIRCCNCKMKRIRYRRGRFFDDNILYCEELKGFLCECCFYTMVWKAYSKMYLTGKIDYCNCDEC